MYEYFKDVLKAAEGIGRIETIMMDRWLESDQIRFTGKTGEGRLYELNLVLREDKANVV